MLETDDLIKILPLEIWDKVICYLRTCDIISLVRTTKSLEQYIAKQETFLKCAFQEFLPQSSISKVKNITQQDYYDIEFDRFTATLKLRFPKLSSESDSSTLRQLQLLHQVNELQLQSTEAFQRACMFQNCVQGDESEYKRRPPRSMKLTDLAGLQQNWVKPYPLPADYVFILTKYSDKFWYNTYFGYMDNLWHGLRWGDTRSGALRLIHLNSQDAQSELPSVFLEIAGRFQVPTLSILLDVSPKSLTFGQVFIKEGIQEPKWVDWSVTDFLARIADYAREDWVEADLFTVVDHLFLSQNSIPESRISF